MFDSPSQPQGARGPMLAAMDALRAAQVAYEALVGTLPLEMFSIGAGLPPVAFTTLDGIETTGYSLAGAKLAEATDAQTHDAGAIKAHYAPIRRKLSAKAREVSKQKEECGLTAAEALVMWTEQAAIHVTPTTPWGFAEKIRFLMRLEEQAPQPGDIFDVFLEELAGREFGLKSS